MRIPTQDAVFPGWWMNEGGQSSTGQLLDFILTTHPAYNELVERGKRESKNIFLRKWLDFLWMNWWSQLRTVLDDILEQLRIERGAKSLTELTKDLHIYPDLHGQSS